MRTFDYDDPLAWILSWNGFMKRKIGGVYDEEGSVGSYQFDTQVMEAMPSVHVTTS